MDDLLGQISSGSINPDLLHNSGLVNELSKATGLDNATATKTLDAAFSIVGEKMLGKKGKKR